MLLEFSYVHEDKAGDCMVEQDSEKKSVIFFFLFLVGRILFHCLEYSNEIQLKRQQMSKKNNATKKQQKAEISMERLN